LQLTHGRSAQIRLYERHLDYFVVLPTVHLGSTGNMTETYTAKSGYRARAEAQDYERARFSNRLGAIIGGKESEDRKSVV
jgi:hypothetical protein